MENSFTAVRSDGSLYKKTKHMKYTGCKRVKDWSKDPDASDSSEESEAEPEIKHREKREDERDALIEMFTKLLSNVGTNTELLKPVFETAIHKILMQHFEQSDIQTITLFINTYKDIIDPAWIETAFTKIKRLEIRHYLWTTYPDIINKRIPESYHCLFSHAVCDSDLNMAKFIYEISPPNHINPSLYMHTARTEEMKDFLCSIDSVEPIAVAIHYPSSFENIPKAVRKLHLINGSYNGDFNLTEFTQLTHLYLTGWVRTSQNLHLPPSLTHLSLGAECYPYLNIEHYRNLETVITHKPEQIPISIKCLEDFNKIPKGISTVYLHNDGYRGDYDLSQFTKLRYLGLGGDMLECQTLYGPVSLTKLEVNEPTKPTLNIRNCLHLNSLKLGSNYNLPLDLTANTKLTTVALGYNFNSALKLPPSVRSMWGSRYIPDMSC